MYHKPCELRNPLGGLQDDVHTVKKIPWKCVRPSENGLKLKVEVELSRRLLRSNEFISLKAESNRRLLPNFQIVVLHKPGAPRTL